MSRGPKVGPLFTETTSLTVRPQDAIATAKPKVGSLVNVALRSDSQTSVYQHCTSESRVRLSGLETLRLLYGPLYV